MSKTIFIYLFIIGTVLNINAQSGSQLKYADSIKNMGNYEKAAKLYTNILKDIAGREDILLYTYSNRAFCYKKLALYSMANDDYDESIKLANLLNHNNKYSLYVNKSDLLIQMGAYEEAERFLLSIPYESGNYKVDIVKLANLSSVYQRLGKMDLAIKMIDSIIPKVVDKYNKRTLYQNRACAYMNLSHPDYLQALRDFNLALSLGLEKDADHYIILSNKAVVDAHLGNFKEALESIKLCIKWFQSNFSEKHSDYIILLRKRAEILYLMRDYSKSKKAFRDYYSVEKSFILANFMSMTEQNRLDFWKKEKPLISEIFALEHEDPVFLYDVALFRRQVALLGRNDSLSIRHKLSCSEEQVAKKIGKKDVAIEFVKYEKEKKNRYAALIISRAQKRRVEFVPLWTEDSIKTFNVGGNRLDSALCSKIRADKERVYQNESLSSYVWDKLLPYIPEGSTVYFAPDGILHLLAIEYLPTVNNGRYEFHRLTTTALLAESSKKQSRAKPKSLVIGGMDYDFIPPKDNSPSTTTNQDAFKYLLQNKMLLHFSHLPGSKKETDSIATYLTSIDRYEDIDESILKDKMGNYNNVHLATHGYSWHIDVPSVPYAYRDSITEDKSLLASGIAISGANWLYLYPRRDDGLLSARELCEMDLTNVELVVASSCQSAQGRVSDEGPTSLVRGLKKAGVKSIIASLWPVSDKPTMLLMQFFYDEWREGNGKDGKGCSKTRALHLAQERLRNVEGTPIKVRTYNTSTKKGDYRIVTTTYNSPYYWAPFIIIDDI